MLLLLVVCLCCSALEPGLLAVHVLLAMYQCAIAYLSQLLVVVWLADHSTQKRNVQKGSIPLQGKNN